MIAVFAFYTVFKNNGTNLVDRAVPLDIFKRLGSSNFIQRTRGRHGEQDDEVVLGRLGPDADERVDKLYRHVHSHPQPQRRDASNVCHN